MSNPSHRKREIFGLFYCAFTISENEFRQSQKFLVFFSLIKTARIYLNFMLKSTATQQKRKKHYQNLMNQTSLT